MSAIALSDRTQSRSSVCMETMDTRPCEQQAPTHLSAPSDSWVAESIVVSWLRSLDLAQYCTAFVDNGYDDLETCRAIGSEDLDAIGVECPAHRQLLVDAVEELRREGGTHVYFILDPQPASTHRPLFLQRPLPLLPRSQLSAALKERLRRDGVDIDSPRDKDAASFALECVDDLATKYADELNTPYKEIARCLQDLLSGGDGEPLGTPSPTRGVCGPYGGPDQAPYDLISVYGQSPRSVPPPQPACSPGSHNYEDPNQLDPNQRGTPSHSSRCPLLSKSNDNSLDATDGPSFENTMTRTNSTLGRILRLLGVWRAEKKYTYKQHEGDLKACDITMSEEDRIELMIRVKDGRISVKEALDIVKDYEYQHLRSSATHLAETVT